MRCRQCGTEIADNALICYRCGTAVEELPSLPPASERRRVGLLGPALAFVVIVLAGLFLIRAVGQEAPVELTWILLALAAIVFASWVRIRTRRRRR